MEIRKVEVHESTNTVLISVAEMDSKVAVRMDGNTDLQGVTIGYWDEEKERIYY